MLTEIERFVNWVRRRNANARALRPGHSRTRAGQAWYDFRSGLEQFVVEDRPPGCQYLPRPFAGDGSQ